MKRALCAFLLVMVAFVGYGQAFLSNYPKLTRQNLDRFFVDWEAYSDSIASRATKNDSLMDRIQCLETVPETQGWAPRYVVLPRYLIIERYDLDVDLEKARQALGFPSFIPDLEENQYVVERITPLPPRSGRVLYLTADINKVLSAFAGGLEDGDRLTRIKRGNVRRLQKYLPVQYGHWGGYWWFTSFPLITGICRANNLIAVMRRTSWCTGDEIWYVKENDEFVRQPEPVSFWME